MQVVSRELSHTASAPAEQLTRLLDVGRGVEAGRNGGVLVITGAGLSTESGIPDYRGVTGRARPSTPMTYQEFIGHPDARRRYWARSHVGWRTIAQARPNSGHHAVGSLQTAGLLGTVITQNVDGLHQAGGASDVIELHGSLDRVVCLDCADLSSRTRLEDRLSQANPYLDQWIRAGPHDVKPDGDVDLAPDLVARFRTAPCERCSGDRLKPDVVFFGESVPKPTVARCFELVERAGALLVLGSSLSVMSGYRFIRRARRLGLPIGIVNQGATRADADATFRVDAPLGPTLETLLSQVVTRAAGSGHAR